MKWEKSIPCYCKLLVKKIQSNNKKKGIIESKPHPGEKHKNIPHVTVRINLEKKTQKFIIPNKAPKANNKS